MELKDIIKEQRRLIIKLSYKARQGHLSSSMSILEIINVLYRLVMKFDPAQPDSIQNDRFVLSKGHASLALYSLLFQMGVITEDKFYSFSQYDSILGEHPDRNKVPSVDVSTGSLGHGFPTAVGMAIGFKAQNMPNRVYTIIGDGEANEGSIWEAAYVASERKLDNLTCIVDDNSSASHMPNIGAKFEAFGWQVISINGNDVEDVKDALSVPHNCPLLVWAHTIKGYGCKIMENDPEGWHHRVVSENEYNELMEELS